MSSKDNADNHSNQLNPNNDAYYSSRGIDRDYDDDDGDNFSSNRSFALEIAERSAAIERKRDELICERFTLDFLSLDGGMVNSELTAACPRENYRRNGIRDCIDIIERVMPMLKREFVKVAGFPIASLRVRNERGVALEWLCEEFQPSKPSYSDDAEAALLKLKYSKMWESSGKSLVEKFIQSLEGDKIIFRESLGKFTPDLIGKL